MEIIKGKWKNYKDFKFLKRNRAQKKNDKWESLCTDWALCCCKAWSPRMGTLSWKVKAMALFKGGQSESVQPQITQARPVHRHPERRATTDEMSPGIWELCGKERFLGPEQMCCVSHSASLPPFATITPLRKEEAIPHPLVLASPLAPFLWPQWWARDRRSARVISEIWLWKLGKSFSLYLWDHEMKGSMT